MKHFAKETSRLKYIEGESYALNSLGIIYRNISLYSKALEKHEQAEELAEKANNLLQFLSVCWLEQIANVLALALASCS